MDKIAIISSGYFPVPAIKGGAVETLIENLAYGNEKEKLADITIFTTFDIDAFYESKKYKNSNFKFINTPKIVRKLDKLMYFIFKKVLRVKKHMSFRYIFQRIYYIYAVSKNLKNNDFDKIILENTSTLFLTLKLFNNKEKYKNKVYYHLHNEVNGDFGCSEIIVNSKKVIGVSQYINDSFRKNYTSYPDNKMEVLLNCIDIENLKLSNCKSDIRKKYNINENDIVYIFTGRLCEEKGIKETIEAFSKLKFENIKLLVVGNYYFGTDMKSDFEDELFRLASRLDNKIIFTGFIPNSKLVDYYSCSDIAILPSVWNEPAGLTVIEAMASGLPVITTDVGGIPEYTNKDCSILIKRDNNIVESLKNAMEELYSNKEKRDCMRRHSIRISKNYSKENYLKNFIEVLKD